MIVSLPVTVADHGVDSNGDPCATDASAIGIGPYVTPDLFIYAEDNDVPGLQRGDDNSDLAEALDFGGDDGDCTHPDTIIF